jgi:hypothetical protein
MESVAFRELVLRCPRKYWYWSARQLIPVKCFSCSIHVCILMPTRYASAKMISAALCDVAYSKDIVCDVVWKGMMLPSTTRRF